MTRDGADRVATKERSEATPGRRSKRRDRGLVATLLLPVSGAAALFGKFGGGAKAAGTLGHEAAATGIGKGIAAATGAKGAGVAGAAAAEGMGGAGAAAAAPSAPPAPALGGQAAVVGGAAVTAVVAGIAVVAIVRDDPQPVVEDPPPAPTTVPAVVEPPSIAPAVLTTPEIETAAGNLLADVDASGTALVIEGVEGSPAAVGSPVTLASGATVTVQADGSYVYDPAEAFKSLGSDDTATDEFTYTVTDGADFTTELTATVTVSGVNDPPTLGEVEPTVTVAESASSTITVSATDPDADDLVFVLREGAPAFVSLADSGGGTATLTIAPGRADGGTYEVEVTVSDSGTPTMSESVTLTVTVRQTLARVTDGLLALYDFEEGSGAVAGNSATGGSVLDLTVADPAAVSWADGALSIDSPTVVSSGGAGAAVIGAATASNAITIEAWVTPAVADQTGPARVVSLSADTLARNVTLGQGETEGGVGNLWTTRLRTTTTSTNGLPAVATSAGTATTGLTHLVYTRTASGEVAIYVDGRIQATGTVAGDLSNWDPGYSLLLGNEATMDRPWLGSYHLVAVYGKALSAAEVDQNRRVGARP